MNPLPLCLMHYWNLRRHGDGHRLGVMRWGNLVKGIFGVVFLPSVLFYTQSLLEITTRSEVKIQQLIWRFLMPQGLGAY